MKILEKIKAWVKKHYPTVKKVAAEAWNSSKKAAKVAAPYLKEAAKFLWEIAVFIATTIKEVFTSSSDPEPKKIVIPYEKQLEYEIFLKTFIECVSNNYGACGLTCPKNDEKSWPQYIVTDRCHIIPNNGYEFLYLYQFDRTVDVKRTSNGMERKFSTISVQDMIKSINSVLSNYCIADGWSEKRIKYAENLDNGRVCFTVGPFYGEKQ